jgi:hypothetical protein
MITVPASPLPPTRAMLAVRPGFRRLPVKSSWQPLQLLRTVGNSTGFKTLLIHFVDAASYSAAIPEFDIEVLS